MFDYNFKTDQFKYETLYEGIREDIINGHLKPDQKLPGRREMAANLHISITSVKKAYELLTDEGWLYVKEKSGYYIKKINYRMKPVKPFSIPAEDPKQEKAYEIDFKANQVSTRLFPFSQWSRCMRNALNYPTETLSQTVPWQGLYQLRASIAKYLYENRSMAVNPANIIIGAGTEYLYTRLLMILPENTVIAAGDTGTHTFASIARHLKIRFDKVPLEQQNMSPDQLAKDVTIAQLSPANLFPIGRAMPVDQRIAFFEWVNAKPGRYLIEDDYDSEFRYDGGYKKTMFSEDTQNKVIYMNTFSKTMIPSLRISYMILPDDLLETYEKNIGFYANSVSTFEQYALSEFMEEGYFQRHLDRLLTYYRKHRQNILTAIRNDKALMQKTRIEEYGAGTHFLLHIHTDKTEQQLIQSAEQSGMYLSFWHGSHKDHEQILVINYAAIPNEKIQQALKLLDDVITVM
ncbi:MAG: PLP-dependent aminotransferase family protein [Lactimicrobium sp.]|jgi:GntR family transcriptional regulator/MocR family aminotransferase|uniref:MocR-like pyridoxine biosynthesis transcription factor PdxR n=1 Tax=Lactimicrobium sp. TaxID=2563780 RepID=UPI002F350D62